MLLQLDNEIGVKTEDDFAESIKMIVVSTKNVKETELGNERQRWE